MITCPPLSLEDMVPQLFERQDLLYFNLHGVPSQPYYYGDDWVTAISADLIRKASLASCGVFLGACFTNRQHPMVRALFDAGAAYIVGGDGPNYGSGSSLIGSDLLGKWFVTFLRLGLGPDRALAAAKLRLKISLRLSAADADTLEFQILRP
jgi:hypothetical protein